MSRYVKYIWLRLKKVWNKLRSHKRSRSLIQTPDPDLKGVDPDLWNDIYIIYGRVDVWSNDVTCFLGFPALRLFTLPSSQATNYCKATRSQAATVARPTCQAVKLPSGHCCKARLPSSQAVHLLPAHLVFLFLSPSIQAATYTKTYIGPIL